jgi:hypothetical protein
MYDVCQSSGGLPGLIELVNRYIKAGWKPLGGVATDAGYFFQAIYKDEPVEAPKATEVKLPVGYSQSKQAQENRHGKGNSSAK